MHPIWTKVGEQDRLLPDQWLCFRRVHVQVLVFEDIHQQVAKVHELGREHAVLESNLNQPDFESVHRPGHTQLGTYGHLDHVSLLATLQEQHETKVE